MADAERQKKLRAAASKNNHKFLRTFASSEGQEVLTDLRERFYERTSVVPGDPYATHAREGAREVVLYILDRIKRAESSNEGLDERPA